MAVPRVIVGGATAPGGVSALRRALGHLDTTFGSGAAGLLVALVGAAGVNVLVRIGSGGFHEPAVDHLFLGLLLVSLPLEAVSLLVARNTARARASGGPVAWERLARRVAVATAVVAAVGVAVVLDRGGPVGHRWESVVAVGVCAVLMGTAVVPRAVLLGRGRFEDVTAAVLAGTGARLLGIAAAWVMGGSGLALVAAVLATGEAVACRIVWIRASGSPGEAPSHLVVRPGEILGTTVALAGVWGLVLVELWLAGRYLPPVAREQYTAALDAARAALFVPQALITVAVARLAPGGAQARDVLRFVLRVTVAAGGVITMVLVGRSLLPLAGGWGSPRPVPVDLVLVVGIAACALGVLLVLVAAAVVREVPGATTGWWALMAIVGASWYWHAGPAVLAAGFVLVALVAAARLLAGPSLVGPASTWPETERRMVPEATGPHLELSIVVPSFNPGAERLHRHLLALARAVEAEGVSYELIAVSDGSTDGSDVLPPTLEAMGVRVLALPRNSGKGAALQAGLRAARGRYLGFIDADGDIPAHLWHHFWTLMRLYDADMVVGSKHHPLSEVEYSPLRRIMSRTYRMLAHALFRVGVADTQTGIKLFRREVLADVLPLVVEQGFVFDLELLVIARRRGWRRVLEAPVRVERQAGSTVSARSVLRMFARTVTLAARLHVLRLYDLPEARVHRDLALGAEGVAA